jgi:hypothetical protein
MPKYYKTISFDAESPEQAEKTQKAMQILLNRISDKKHLIELADIVDKKPGLIEKAIPKLPLLKFL